jgi:hypothetical protein
MTTGQRRTRWGGVVALLMIAAAIGGCQDLLFEDPAPAAGIALSFSIAPPAPADGRILAQVEYDQIRVLLVNQANEEYHEQTVDVASSGETRVQFEVELEGEAATYLVEVQLLNGGQVVGRGSAAVQVQQGSTTPVSVDIDEEGRVILLPEQREGQTRIVLTWGENPRDLDSHLLGPDGEGGQFHIYYANRGSLDQPPYAVLDTDDTSSFGPETITIDRQLDGTYCYYVYHFGGSGTLATSEANVAVYQNNERVGDYDVPTDQGDDRFWTVFTLDGETIETINSVSSQATCPATNP